MIHALARYECNRLVLIVPLYRVPLLSEHRADFLAWALDIARCRLHKDGAGSGTAPPAAVDLRVRASSLVLLVQQARLVKVFQLVVHVTYLLLGRILLPLFRTQLVSSGRPSPLGDAS